MALFARRVVRLPDHPRMLRELRLLERSTGNSGQDAVNHGRNGHDDFSNVACGVLRVLNAQAVDEQEVPITMLGYAANGVWISEPRVLTPAAESEQPVDGAVLANRRRPPRPLPLPITSGRMKLGGATWVIAASRPAPFLAVDGRAGGDNRRRQ